MRPPTALTTQDHNARNAVVMALRQAPHSFRDVMGAVQWEYRFERIAVPNHDPHAAVDLLDALGAEGWEAVSFSPAEATSHGLRSVQTTEYVVLLKRPRVSAP